jgi:hypothetical protein
MKSSELFGRIRTHEQLTKTLDQLIDSWCQERHLDGLRLLLPVWPLHTPLTDGWGDLMVALRAIENAPTLKPDQRDAVHAAAEYVTGIVHTRLGHPGD